MLSVKKSNFIQLFRKGNFIIPTYQRGYVWQKNEWEDFYNDARNIVELKKYKVQHFMGTILLMKKDDNHEIIDGQQRLITILLFIKAFETVYVELVPDLEKARIELLLENTLEVTDTNGIFSSIIHGTFNEGIETTNNASTNIKNAYLFFKNKINNSGKPLFNKRIRTDDNLYRMLLKLIFIEINIDENSNPYLIFETLNARGVDLNISDLVKNHLVEKAKNKQFVTDSWRRFTDGLNEDQFEELFQYFYNSNNNKKRLLKQVTGNINTDENVRDFIEKLSLYVQSYKNFSDMTKTYPMQEIQEYISYLNHMECSLFKIIAIPAKVNFIDKLQNPIGDEEKNAYNEQKEIFKKDLKRFQEEFKKDYIEEHGSLNAEFRVKFNDVQKKLEEKQLWELKKQFKKQYKDEYQKEFIKILKLLEIFIFRYLVISKKDEKVFRQELFKIAQKIYSNEINTANEIYNLLYKDFFVENEEFANAFSYIRLTYSKREKYRYNNQGFIVKYILYRLENYLRGDKLLNLIGTQTNDVSIEHIENDSSGNMPDAFKYRLGNYALMKEEDNNQAGLERLEFIDKKARFYSISTYLTIFGGKKNRKTLSSLITRYPLWSQEDIRSRQRQMARLAVDLWSLDVGQFTLDVTHD